MSGVRGAYVVDTRTDVIGEVMAAADGVLWLRPPRGGREWEVPQDAVRPPTAAEALRAKLARANIGHRWGR